uniref:Theta defensin subunit B n=1 Tax=Papio hamadryas TaxID=9557 RepID=BTDB_PAPHA|nr:RecName: Full=Theta defensin subunit B [Papio hamadryas]
RCVCRRGVC